MSEKLKVKGFKW